MAMLCGDKRSALERNFPMNFRLFLQLVFCIVLLTPQPAAARAAKPVIKADVEVGREIRDGFAGNYLAGRMASGYKDLDASSHYLKKALSFDPKNAELQARTFVVLVGSGRINEALEFAPALLKQKNADKLVELVSAIDDFKHKQFKKALTLINVPKRGDVTDITSGLLGAWALYGTGDAKGAIAMLDRLKGPEWVVIFRNYHAGLIATLSKDNDEANTRFSKAYKTEAKVLRVAQAQAVQLARAGKRDEALQVVRDFLSQVPSNALMTKLSSDIEAGREIPPLVADAAQGAGEVMFGLGAALARNGGDELAAIYLQLALYLDDKNELSLISLADLFEQLKQPEKVMETLRRVPADSPLKAAAEVQLAVALDAEDHTDEALKHLDGILAKDATDMEALITKGNVLRVHKRFAEAQTYYEKALTLVTKPEQRHWVLYYFRGITYERTKQWPKAEADFKKALELQPDQPSVLNYLGYSWIDRNLNLEEGMTMLKRAVQQSPNDGYIIDSVGWAYYRMRQYDEAVSWLLRAVAKKPSDPVINDHLGDAYWKVERKLEAYFQWRQAKDMKPEPDDLDRIEAKLKNGLTEEAAGPPPAIGLNNERQETGKN
jgi:tetratricopeptide (TPR) repeat protein